MDRRHEMRARDIDGNVGGKIRQLVQEQSRLDAGPAAKLHEQRIGSDAGGYRRGVPLENVRFRAGDVLLGELADLIEKL